MSNKQKVTKRGPNPERDAKYIKAAKEEYHEEGVCEIDDKAVVSYSDDGGAYVQAWVWVEQGAAEPNPEHCECGRDWDDCAMREGWPKHADRF